MAYFMVYLFELITGIGALISAILAFLVLHCANFKPRHIEIIIKKKWPRMPRALVKLIYVGGILLMISPIFCIVSFAYFCWEEVFDRTFSLAVGTGTLSFMIYCMLVGFFSWKRSMWCLNSFQKLCFICTCLSVIGFGVTFDYFDPMFDYETHSVFFFVGSLVIMVLFTYSLFARSAINLHRLYTNFLAYYESRLKSRPPPEEKVEILPVPAGANSSEDADRSPNQSKKGEAKDDPQNAQDRSSELRMINMSQVLSHVSVESGDMSHEGQVPQVFPDVPPAAEPEEKNVSPQPNLAENRYREELREIVEITNKTARSHERNKCLMYLVVLAATYTVYNIEYANSSKRPEYLTIGIVQTFFLIFFDILYRSCGTSLRRILLWSRSYLQPKQISITITCLLMLMCRIALSASLSNWVFLHCFICAVLSSVIAYSLCEY